VLAANLDNFFTLLLSSGELHSFRAKLLGNVFVEEILASITCGGMEITAISLA
jgi:hypothetical protein